MILYLDLNISIKMKKTLKFNKKKYKNVFKTRLGTKINKDKDRSSASINKLAADTSSTRKVLFQCYKDENVRHDNNDDIDDDDGGDNDSSSVTDRSLPLTR